VPAADVASEAPEQDSHSDSSSVDVHKMEVEAQNDAGSRPQRKPADEERVESEAKVVKKEGGAGSPAAESPAAGEATASVAKGVVEDATSVRSLVKVAGSSAAGGPAVPLSLLASDAGNTAGSTAAGSTAVQGDVTDVILSPSSPAFSEDPESSQGQ